MSPPLAKGLKITGKTLTTTQQQNVIGGNGAIGYFPDAWPEFNMVRPGWSVVEIPQAIVVDVDSVNKFITITGAVFENGEYYTFTGKGGSRIAGGFRFTSV